MEVFLPRAMDYYTPFIAPKGKDGGIDIIAYLDPLGDWSIYEWDEARRGDMFYMMRVGDDKAGIVFSGQFITDPYPDDWDGSSKRRMYVDLVCVDPVEPGEEPHISLEKLMTAIPDFDWQKGHSGELLPEEVTEKLDELYQVNLLYK